MVLITILTGFINQLITGGHHPVGNDKINMMIDSIVAILMGNKMETW